VRGNDDATVLVIFRNGEGHIGHINERCESEVYFLLKKLCILLGSDPAWALSDTKLNSEDLRLARRRAASE
jgi:hypothetical protein